MRLSDLGDYFALRRSLVRPWEFIRLRKRPLRGPFHEVAFRDGRVVRIRSPMDRHIFHRIFARDEYRLRGAAPGSFDTVIDLGAHIGLFAVRAAPLARRVLAYEPAPDNYQLLRWNTARLPQVEARPILVGSRPGRATLFVSSDASGHSVFEELSGPGSRALEVEQTSLEEVFARESVARCDLLKLDCEGAEHEILRAIPRALWERIERVALEYHPLPGGGEASSGPGLARHLEAMGHRAVICPSRKDPGRGRIFSRRG